MIGVSIMKFKTMNMNYQITVSYGLYKKEYLAYRDGNTFYYDYDSPIGCSTIDINNKRLLSYVKNEFIN
jgi:hypothetical protein